MSGSGLGLDTEKISEPAAWTLAFCSYDLYLVLEFILCSVSRKGKLKAARERLQFKRNRSQLRRELSNQTL
jgi:hypothetical protein